MMDLPYSENNVRKLSEFIAPKFRQLKWGWAFTGIPEKEDIEKLFFDLVKDVKSNTTQSFTGGLFVNRRKGDDAIFIGVDKKFKKVISKAELDLFFQKKPNRRLLRLEGSND